uniref:Uncharacterized protein n=1 Tax=Manihot esculenta TaxID=3983 RepID=A0A2C9VYE3_MANES
MLDSLKLFLYLFKWLYWIFFLLIINLLYHFNMFLLPLISYTLPLDFRMSMALSVR